MPFTKGLYEDLQDTVGEYTGKNDRVRSRLLYRTKMKPYEAPRRSVTVQGKDLGPVKIGAARQARPVAAKPAARKK